MKKLENNYKIIPIQMPARNEQAFFLFFFQTKNPHPEA